MRNKSLLKFGIIGCGLIGGKRAQALNGIGTIVVCADTDINRAQKMANTSGALAISDWQQILSMPEVDAVVVATLHDSLAEISLACINAKKHVFIEKPGARLSSELIPLINAAEQKGVTVRVGFNHRYHRSVLKAQEIINSGILGDLMFIRARYGHGGRIGYDREWRADYARSGGGELIDQGPHLIDLSRLFLGNFTEVTGFAHTYFWDMNVDDNGFALLKTPLNQVAFLHVSCTEWKNLFSMEIYGKLGKIDLSGLGGSYGVEKITLYKMLPEMGPPETISWEFPMHDNSWEVELREFIKDISLAKSPQPGLSDAYEALKIIEKIYLESGYDYRS